MKRCAPLVGIALLSILFGTVQAQDINKAKALLEEALKALTPPPPVPVIKTAAELDAALPTAAVGAVLQLAPEFTYPGLLTLKQSVTLQGVVGSEAMDADTPLPKFTGGLVLAGDNLTVEGVEVTRSTVGDIVWISGAHVTLNRSRVMGHPVNGVKRCITLNGKGDVNVLRNWVVNCFLPSPGQDSQAIGGWEMDPGVRIENNHLEGGSETVMFGGADNTSEDKTPADIVIRGNWIGKKLEWFGMPIGVKNVIELKNAKRVLVENNRFCCSWVQGQTGFAVTLTVRNQDGRNPWATIRDVVFRNNVYEDTATAIAILGRDDIKETLTGANRVPVGQVRPSVTMENVSFSNETFLIDPVKYGKGSTNMKAIQIGGGPIDLSMDHITVKSLSRVGSALSFSAGPVSTRFIFTNNTVPVSRYGLFGDNSTATPSNWTSTNPTWIKYNQGGTIGPVVVEPLVVP